MYIKYLSQAFFVCIHNNYSTNTGKVIRKNKKVYITDSGLRNALLRNDELSPETEGSHVENSLIQMARSYSEPGNYDVCFWRDNQKEVDIVIDKKTGLLPVEVKYRNDITDKDVKSMYSFMQRYNVESGVVITKNHLAFQNNLHYIPFWLM
jgi:predicted AAA+ superfamily ATPase